MRATLIVMSLAALLAACGETQAPEPPRAPAPPAAPEPPTAPTPPAAPLETMVFDEFSSVVPPGLGCAFQTEAGVLFVASADDDRNATARAVIKTGGRLIPLTGRQTGGYAGLVEPESAYAGDGVAVTVAHDGGEGRLEGIETTVWPARLTLTRGDGTAATLTGDWGCGA